MPDPSAFHRVGPTLQRQNQHYNRVIRRVISTSRSHILPYTSGRPGPTRQRQKPHHRLEHSTPATHHHHRAVSRSLTPDQALHSISTENGSRAAQRACSVCFCSFPEAVPGQACDENVVLWPRLTNVGPLVLQRVSLEQE